MPLVMAFVRDYGNVIDFQIPITGSMKHPRFHLKDVIFDVLKNMFIKPVTTPYRMEVKSVETEIEKSLTLTWQMRQTELRSSQEKFIEKVADYLEKTPGASIDVYPFQYTAKEKEYILLYEARKKYFAASQRKEMESFSEDDSEKIMKLSVKDSLFVKFLDKHTHDAMLFTVQDKCSRLVNESTVNAHLQQLNKARLKSFLTIFKEKKLETRVRVHNTQNSIPYNGFSFYKIMYSGELPGFLVKAYDKLRELNDEAPRKKYSRRLNLKVKS
jgi:uncharacterized protein YdcH (DUF465 family)